jgi:hypothetical protein
MPETPTSRRWPRAAFALAFGLLAHTAWAEGERLVPPVPPLPKYQQECGACHLSYLPGLLPAASWQRVMSGLPRHFGTDASLDAVSAREISTWLAAHAGSGKRGGGAPPEDRITHSAWFVREHGEVPVATWQRAAVKSASNCAACHTQATQGAFNEHDIRIPR